MPKNSKRLFETDRKMELRLRLAIKKAGEREAQESRGINPRPPARDLLDRLILRVEQL